MTFVLRAPYPAIRTTTLLPSPRFSDQDALRATIQTLRSVDGTLYTYVTSRDGLHKLTWEFRLSRHKAMELREFIEAFNDDIIKVTDHNDVTWIGYLKNNPFEFTGDSRAADWPGEELTTVTLEFEER